MSRFQLKTAKTNAVLYFEHIVLDTTQPSPFGIFVFIFTMAFIMSWKFSNAFYNIVQREHETLQIIGKAAEFRDPETANHIARVAHYSKMPADVAGKNTEQQNIICPYKDPWPIDRAIELLLDEHFC